MSKAKNDRHCGVKIKNNVAKQWSKNVASQKTQGDESYLLLMNNNLRPQHVVGQWHIATAMNLCMVAALYRQVDCYFSLTPQTVLQLKYKSTCSVNSPWNMSQVR